MFEIVAFGVIDDALGGPHGIFNDGIDQQRRAWAPSTESGEVGLRSDGATCALPPRDGLAVAFKRDLDRDIRTLDPARSRRVVARLEGASQTSRVEHRDVRRAARVAASEINTLAAR